MKKRSDVISAVMASEDRSRVARLLRKERVNAHAAGMEEGYLFAMREVRRREDQRQFRAEMPSFVTEWVDGEIARLTARGVK